MSRIEDIDRYLRAHLGAQRMPGPTQVESRAYPFVTISRQAGTGAHVLANTMLEIFTEQDDADLFGGWRVYDRSICEMVVQDKKFAGSLELLVEEEYRSRTNDFFHQMLRSTVDQTMLMNRVFLVVRAISGMGKAIIVGRGGAHVTKDMPLGVSFRIVAPEDVRIARAMDVHDLTENEARAGLRKRDSDRARLIRSHFATDIDDPTSYDGTWNVGSVSFEEISRAAASIVRCRAQDNQAER
jgi:hypothetical protein